MPHPSDEQAAAFSLSADIERIMGWSNTWNMSLNPDKSHSHSVSPKGPLANTLIYFLNNALEDVQSLKLLGLTRGYDHSWTNNTSKWDLQSSLLTGFLHHAKPFLGTPELLSTCKAFVHSFMKDCPTPLDWRPCLASYST